MLAKKLSIIVIPAIVFALLTCDLARANLVLNGGFEAISGSPPKDFASNCMPTDWTITGGQVFLDAPCTATTAPGIQVYGPFPNTSPNLGNFIESDGSPGFAFPISQMINSLTIGQSYGVSFYQAAGQEVGDLGATTEQWQVSLGSQTQFSPLMSIPQGGMFNWNQQTLTFTATAASETLSFLAIGAGGNPPIVFLDGVDMETSVPEPSAGLLLLCVGAVIAVGRIGRRAMAKTASI
jgi:hypothetical protein